MPEYYIGTSGWHYDHWRGTFYPEDLSKSKWLQFYSEHFNTVELNNSFYRLPTETAFTNWRDSSPMEFAFAVKVNRFITHIKRLKDTDEPVQTFLSRADLLRDKLGPLLYQLPPNMKRNDEVLENFLVTLPGGYCHIVEFRHESWLDDAVFKILRGHNTGLCVFDMPDFSCPMVATADFVYIRFHGSSALYSSCYSDEELSDWVNRIARLGPDITTVYIYFNNDAEGNAIKNARTMRTMLTK